MKYEQVSESTQSLFEEIIVKNKLDNFMDISIVHSDKMKYSPLGFCGKVTKIPDHIKAAIGENRGKNMDIVIILNDNIFMGLPTPQQIMVIEKLLAQISYDLENDKLTIAQPDIQDFASIRKKYSHDELEVLTLATQSLYEKKKEDDDAEADAKPKKRKGKF